MSQDAVLHQEPDGFFDFELTETGDILVDDFFDTALLMSIYGQQRANEQEMPVASRRRGWIGNEGESYENGSKLWLISQARINRTTLNNIETTAANALQWFVTDGLADYIEEPRANVIGGRVGFEATIRRSNEHEVNRWFTLWNRTGIR